MVGKRFAIHKDPKKYEDKIKAILALGILFLPGWKAFLMAPMSDLVDEMIESGSLPIATADAFDDFGQFCQRLGSDIIRERMRRGLPMPTGPDD